MDLFDLADYENGAKPLAERMRACSIKDFVGQKHIVFEGSLLMRAISLDKLGSCIFFGPPGCGKTTLANIIASTTHANFVKLNAVQCGIADVKKAVEQAKNDLRLYNKRTYLMLDECHRFNKAQSDSLLPAIEQGTIIFIGSTTVNPFASMTPAIVSRCRVFEFKPLSDEDIAVALRRALADKRRGLGNYKTEVSDEAINHLAKMSGGDLRMAYNGLELAVLTTTPQKDNTIIVTLADAEQSIQRKALSYDEDMYYNMLSAFCKSLRGSDSNAALYYAMRLIEGGCDPLLILRRTIAHSAEDIGLADPNALIIATSALTAFQNMGLPEGLLPLTEAIIYVCEAEKSNSVVTALGEAKKDAVEIRDDTVPPHLKNYTSKAVGAEKDGKGYKYVHNYAGGYVKQQYLPDSIKTHVYYRPSDRGYEAVIKRIRKAKGIED